MFYINKFCRISYFFLTGKVSWSIANFEISTDLRKTPMYGIISYISNVIDVLIFLWLKSPLEFKMILSFKITLTFSHVLMIGSKEFR